MRDDRPQLDPRVPVMTRTSGVQVGLDPGHGVVLSGEPDVLRAALALMDGAAGLVEIADATGLALPDLQAITEALREHDLLVPVPRALPRVRLIGSGALARDLALAIVTTGLGRLVVVDPGAPPPRVYAEPSGTGGETLHRYLQRKGHAVQLDAHWFGGGSGADVTVVADDHAEPDRALTEMLGREGLPHLFVRPLVRGAVVGPLVLPGRTPCTRCMDLVRARDPEWVSVLAQLCRTRLPSPTTVRLWAVGQVLVSLRALAAGACPPTIGTTHELGRDWSVATREWPMHPDCGCAGLVAVA